jgi:transcriptional regulator
MHPNPIFRQTDNDQNLAFVRSRAFGTVSVNADPAPLLAHVPFRLTDDDSYVELHFVRSNPIVKLLKSPIPAVISTLGPDSYISPDWYELAEQVPTWNYVSVHLRGTLELLPQTELRGILDRLSENFEMRLLPKTPWTADKMSPDMLERMMRAIVPCRMALEDVQSTWKLGQNKPVSAQASAAKHLRDDGIGHETHELVEMMQRYSKT